MADDAGYAKVMEALVRWVPLTKLVFSVLIGATIVWPGLDTLPAAAQALRLKAAGALGLWGELGVSCLAGYALVHGVERLAHLVKICRRRRRIVASTQLRADREKSEVKSLADDLDPAERWVVAQFINAGLARLPGNTIMANGTRASMDDRAVYGACNRLAARSFIWEHEIEYGSNADTYVHYVLRDELFAAFSKRPALVGSDSPPRVVLPVSAALQHLRPSN